MGDSIQEVMAKLMKPGDKVVPGRDWNYVNADSYGIGTVIDKIESGLYKYWLKVKWNKSVQIHKMGVGKSNFNSKFPHNIAISFNSAESMFLLAQVAIFQCISAEF